MIRWGAWAAAGLALALAAGCGEESAPADIKWADVKAAEAKGEAEFDTYFQGIRGKAVAWNGHVVEVLMETEDDYMRSAYAMVDMDGGGAGAKADLRFKVPLDEAPGLTPGTAVAFTAKLREVRREGGAPLIQMELQKLGK
ncbi:MAG: hypothetical protein H6907_21255 [Hyphomicrobiales bacterium]|nr:hypothetical protein [Hyphomicrobiales bacterium]MCP5374272.1 hypothetical protein [Hyphomicrobiales bacterium]